MDNQFRPISPLEAIISPSRIGRNAGPSGVIVNEQRSARFISINVLRGKLEALQIHFSEEFGLDIPEAPHRTSNGKISVSWAGPSRWIFSGTPDEMPSSHKQADDLATSLADIAAVVDLSASLVQLSVSGPRVRDALAKGITVDLHPRAFKTGQVAITSVAHIPIHLWQVADAPVYEIATPRSSAESFWSWLQHSSAEYGLEVISAS